MEITFTENALLDLKYWQTSGNKTIQNKISQLLQAIRQDPYRGIGKPEPLKHKLSGCWSRRISKEHRIVYKIDTNQIIVVALRFHYDL
jgi:toxin YoeB